MSRMRILVTTALLGAGCTWHGTPVPVVGPTASLAGEWEGTYFSPQTGRTGSIVFHLKAGTDSAYGDVLMVPVQNDQVTMPTTPQLPGPNYKLPRVLKISFVKCEVNTVTGRLDVYEDPETGERLLTTFEGRLTGDEFRGTFSTLFEGSGRLLAGEWSVKRIRH
jgi:hypothetical protein